MSPRLRPHDCRYRPVCPYKSIQFSEQPKLALRNRTLRCEVYRSDALASAFLWWQEGRVFGQTSDDRLRMKICIVEGLVKSSCLVLLLCVCVSRSNYQAASKGAHLISCCMVQFDFFWQEHWVVLPPGWRNLKLCVIAGFSRDVDEDFAVLGYYATSNGNFLPTFRDKLSVPYSRAKKVKQSHCRPGGAQRVPRS